MTNDECELCGAFSTRLTEGMCAECRERYGVEVAMLTPVVSHAEAHAIATTPRSEWFTVTSEDTQ